MNRSLFPPDAPRTESGSREIKEIVEVTKIDAPQPSWRDLPIEIDPEDYCRWADDGGNNLD